MTQKEYIDIMIEETERSFKKHNFSLCGNCDWLCDDDGGIVGYRYCDDVGTYYIYFWEDNDTFFPYTSR